MGMGGAQRLPTRPVRAELGRHTRQPNQGTLGGGTMGKPWGGAINHHLGSNWAGNPPNHTLHGNWHMGVGFASSSHWECNWEAVANSGTVGTQYAGRKLGFTRHNWATDGKPD